MRACVRTHADIEGFEAEEKKTRDMRVESWPQQQVAPASTDCTPKTDSTLGPFVIMTHYYRLSVCNEESRCGAAHAPLI